MASYAAILSILVKAQGINETASKVRGLDGDLDKTGKTGSKSLGKLAGVAKFAAGTAGIGGLGLAVTSAVGEFQEARKVTALTNAVIKSTGSAAGVSAKHVGELAESISKKAGIDDEAIQSGSNLLLTFTKVRNEVGKGRDIFDQATQAAVDLSAAGFGSLSSTSKQLGKALNDPVKGMTALSRSGVTFSESQKKMIEALMATGKASDRVKAQQLILKEVQTQVGGAAASQATKMDHLKVNLGNLAEKAGAFLVPALDKVAGALSGVLDGTGPVNRAVKDAIGFFKEHETVSLAVGAALAVVAGAFLALKVQAAVAAAITAVTGAMAALNAVILANPIVLIVAALALLAAGLVIAYKESETFREIVDAAFGVVKVAVKALWDVAKVAFPAIVAVVRGAWEAIKAVTGTIWGAINGVLVVAFTAIKTVVTTYFAAYKAIITTAWDAIKIVTGAAWSVIEALIVTPVQSAVSGVRKALGQDGLIGWLEGAWERMKKAVEGLAKPFKTAFDAMGDAVRPIKKLIEDVVGAVKDAVEWIGKIKVPKLTIPNPFGGAGGGNVGPGGSLPSKVDGFNQTAQRFGNVVTSGYRPGDMGWHGQNRARDYAGGDMIGFAQHMAARFGSKLLELIHTPLGFGIKNGQPVGLDYWGAAVNADHFDHVHVAMAAGGHVKRAGWAVVGERGPELAHLPGGTNVYSNRDSQNMMGGGGPMVHIENAQFGSRLDANAMAERLAFRIATAG